MSKLIYKQFPVEKKTVDAERGIFEAMITTESVDRDGDIILATGGDLTNFRKNPVVLDSHMHLSGAVIGKSLKEEVIKGKGIKATFKFASREISERADNIRKLWEGGFLNAVSIGFILHSFDRRTDEDGEELRRGKVFTEWELLEFSIVPVPANQDALRLGYKMMIAQDEPGDIILEKDKPAGEQIEIPTELLEMDFPFDIKSKSPSQITKLIEDISISEPTLEELAKQMASMFEGREKEMFDKFVDMVAGEIFKSEDTPTSESNNNDIATHLDYKEIGQSIKTLKEKVRS